MRGTSRAKNINAIKQYKTSIGSILETWKCNLQKEEALKAED